MKVLMNESNNEINNYCTFAIMFLFATLYIIAYQYFIGLLPHKSQECCSRIVTLIHGATATILCIASYLLTKYCKNLYITNMIKKITLANSFGYFFFDTNWIIWTTNTEKPLMYFHHIMSLYALTVYLFKTESMNMAITALGMLEVSNPYQQLRWLIRDDGKMKTHYILFHTVEIIFCVLFLVMRVFIGTYAILWYIQFSNSDLHDKITCLIGYTVGLIFSRQVLLFIKNQV